MLGPMNQREQNVFHLGRGVVAPIGGFRLLSIIRVKLGHGVHRKRKVKSSWSSFLLLSPLPEASVLILRSSVAFSLLLPQWPQG